MLSSLARQTQIALLFTGCVLSLATVKLHTASSIDSVREFDRTLERYELVIAYFFKNAGKNKSDAAYKETNRMIDALQKGPDGLSDIVRICKVNLAKKQNAALAELYTITSTPLIIFFENGTVRSRIDGTPYINQTPLELPKLAGAIRNTTGQLWADELVRIAKERLRKAQYDAATGTSIGFGYWPYWTYPYWGYPYGPWVYPGLVW